MHIGRIFIITQHKKTTLNLPHSRKYCGIFTSKCLSKSVFAQLSVYNTCTMQLRVSMYTPPDSCRNKHGYSFNTKDKECPLAIIKEVCSRLLYSINVRSVIEIKSLTVILPIDPICFFVLILFFQLFSFSCANEFHLAAFEN